MLNNRIGANVEGRVFFKADGIPPFSPLKGGGFSPNPSVPNCSTRRSFGKHHERNRTFKPRAVLQIEGTSTPLLRAQPSS